MKTALLLILAFGAGWFVHGYLTDKIDGVPSTKLNWALAAVTEVVIILAFF